MNFYLYKQFFRNKAYLIALSLLFFAGVSAVYTGKVFLDKSQGILDKSAEYQKESIAKNVKLHSDNMGLLLYYVKFNFVNQIPRLASLSIGMRDLNPSVMGVTIRNLEEQKHNADFYNPVNASVGNFDFSFVLIYLFPLVIIAFCYNLISEDQERGTWKMLSVHSGDLRRLVHYKIQIRVIAVTIVYLLLVIIAGLWNKIPLDRYFLIFIILGWLYLVFWFALCRWLIAFQRSSAQNALVMVLIWIAINFIIPMSCNLLIQKIYPVYDGFQAQIEQREGYHDKWDEAKGPTMEKFYRAYPQFRKYKVEENASSSYIWYYAMQNAGDMESAASARKYDEKMQQRNNVAEYLGYLFPNIQTLLMQGQLASTGMSNHLKFASALKDFHERKRLFFYPLIFSQQHASAVDWNKQTVQTYSDMKDTHFTKLFLPYLLLIGIFFLLAQNKYKTLC